MENYNQSSQKEENRQSGTASSWYSPNKPYNERNRQQSIALGNPTGYSFSLGEEDTDHPPDQNDHHYEERVTPRAARYGAPDDNNLEDDSLNLVDRLNEEEELASSMHRLNYSSRRNGAYSDAQLTF